MANIFTSIINLEALNTATLLLIFKFKALKALEYLTFIFNIKDLRKINIIIFKENKILTTIKLN